MAYENIIVERDGAVATITISREKVRNALGEMGYSLETAERTSGPINGILFDRRHGTMWGASSNYGEDYGIAW